MIYDSFMLLSDHWDTCFPCRADNSYSDGFTCKWGMSTLKY